MFLNIQIYTYFIIIQNLYLVLCTIYVEYLQLIRDYSGLLFSPQVKLNPYTKSVSVTIAKKKQVCQFDLKKIATCPQ